MLDPGDATVEENTRGSRTKTQWTLSDEVVLVRRLIKARDDGLQAEFGWNPVTWPMVVEALAGSEDVSGGIAKDVVACKGHWQRVSRKCYSLFFCI